MSRSITSAISSQPLLSIAIPTFNRAAFLEQTLTQVLREREFISAEKIEILVSDNCSTDSTEDIVSGLACKNKNFRYIRNEQNIGSDSNIAQCFNKANGTYVLILGDDDMPIDGILKKLYGWLQEGSYGVVYLRAYGYERDMRAEYPGPGGTLRVYNDAGKFIARLGQYLTFISSLVINKECLVDVDAQDFRGGNLVQVHLALRAALLAKHNLYISHYVIAATRNNSGGYDFARVFVTELFEILESYRTYGLQNNAIQALEKRMIITYYPFYLLQMRWNKSRIVGKTYKAFTHRFGKRLIFWVWLAPTMRLPRHLAMGWGFTTMTLGRAIAGDLKRIFVYGVNRVLIRSK